MSARAAGNRFRTPIGLWEKPLSPEKDDLSAIFPEIIPFCDTTGLRGRR